MTKKNYFQIFSLPEKFTIDLAKLEQEYIKLQRQLHPDANIGKDIPLSTTIDSITINEAHATLSNPLKRAIYLLQLKNIDVGDHKNAVKPTTELLVEIIELREDLDNISDIEQLTIMAKANKQEIAGLLRELDQAFTDNNLAIASQQTIKLIYLEKLRQEIKQKNRLLK